MNIKQLGTERLEKIADFDKLCFSTDFWNIEDWKEMLSDEKAIYYALLDEEKIVGNIFIYNWQGKRDYIKIMNLAVHPNYRRQGLAHQLIRYAEEEMLTLGMKRFIGETRESNKAMQSVFEDCGYQLDHIEENYYDDPAENAYKYVAQR